MCGDTKLDKIRNERIRESPKVGEIAMKVQERRRNWCGHMMRKEGHNLGRRMMEMDFQVRRKRRRAKRRWLDRVRGDINENGLSGRELGVRLSYMCKYIVEHRLLIQVGLT